MQKKKTLPEQNIASGWEQNLKQQQRKENFKKYGIWAGILALCFAGLAGLVVFANQTGPTTSAPLEVSNLPAVKSADIVLGDPKAKVTITEYADFQCPACASANPLTNQVLSEYKGKVILVYRFLPLRGIHKNALISGQAAYAAYKLGKFSEMKDLLYENQKSWENLGNPRDTFIGYAKDLGLKTEEFTNLMNSSEAKKAVLAGESEALGLGLNSTPSFFIGNKQFSPQNFDSFKQLIEEELKDN